MRGIVIENGDSDFSITDKKLHLTQLYIYYVVQSCMFQTSKTIIRPSIKILYK